MVSLGTYEFPRKILEPYLPVSSVRVTCTFPEGSLRLYGCRGRVKKMDRRQFFTTKWKYNDIDNMYHNIYYNYI